MRQKQSVPPKGLVILFIAFLLMLCVWPFRLLGTTAYTNQSVEKGLTLSAPITSANPVSGSFTPAHKHLNSFAVKFNTLTDVNIIDGTLFFDLYNDAGELIFSDSVLCTQIKNNDYEIFDINLTLDTAKTYTYAISTSGSSDGAPRLYLGSTAIGPAEQQGLSFCEVPNGKWAVLTLTYTDHLTLRLALVADIVILLTALLILIAMNSFKKQRLCIYLIVLLLGIMFIVLSDESRRPIETKGCNLSHDYGAAAYEYLSINEDSDYTGTWASVNKYALNKGSYSVGVEYSAAGGGNLLTITDNGTLILSEELPATETYMDYPFTLEKDSQEISIQISYGGTGLLTAYSVVLNPISRFYNDSFYYVFVFLLVNLFAVLFYPRVQKKSIFFVLIGIGIFSFFPYMNGSLPWGDDLCYHLIRIEGIKDGLLDGQLPVIIYPEGLHGYGYLNCMYPNLFLYIPAFIRLFGVSIAASYKTLIFLFDIATVFITYRCVKSIHPSTKAALMATILYSCCPYRYTNLYARGAVGEALAMTFMPLLITGLYHILIGNRKKWWMLALAMCGLMQTHILSLTLGAIICFLAGIVYLTQVLREKRLPEIGKAILMTVLLNLWFLVSFLYFYKNGNLSLSALGYSTYSEYSLNLSGLIGTINTSDYRTLTLGLPIVICAAIALFTFVAEKINESADEICNGTHTISDYMKFLFLLGSICVFMLLGQFAGWDLMKLGIFEKLFSTIQFPWRLLGHASIFFVICGCICLYRSKLLKKHADVICIALVCICMLSASRYKEEDFSYEEYTSTYTTGHESKLIGIPKLEHTIVYPYEWRPEGITDSLLTAGQLRPSDETTITITSYGRKGTTTSVSYLCSADDCYIDLPVAYYHGYQAIDENGQKLLTQAGDANLVRVYLNGDGEEHSITLRYRGSLLFTLANLVSFLSLLVYVIYPFIGEDKRKRLKAIHFSVSFTEKE